MRGLRSYGLLALFIGAQIVALALAFPFKTAGLSSTSNPNSAANPLYLIALVVAAPLLILWIARRNGGIPTLRVLILLGIAGSLNITLYAMLSLFTPAAVYLTPAAAGQVLDVALPLASMAAVSLFLALLMNPQWYVVDLAGFIAGGSLIALLGISFGILPTFLLLIALAVYDAIAVYQTKHMISLADVVVEMKLPILMVMPEAPSYDYTKKGSFRAERNIPLEQREAMFMGLGDVVFPGVLIVSAFVSLPAIGVLPGLGGNFLVALGTLAGSLVGYGFLMRLVNRGNAQAGLPLLNGGAIGGYVVSYLLLFHNYTLGMSLSF
ncbi:MAG TPA: presenilin family intramembrane aspartyl protease PSH [Thermoplasmata archaeon]